MVAKKSFMQLKKKKKIHVCEFSCFVLNIHVISIFMFSCEFSFKKLSLNYFNKKNFNFIIFIYKKKILN